MRERSLPALSPDTVSRLLGCTQRRLSSLFLFRQPENSLILMGRSTGVFLLEYTCDSWIQPQGGIWRWMMCCFTGQYCRGGTGRKQDNQAFGKGITSVSWNCSQQQRSPWFAQPSLKSYSNAEVLVSFSEGQVVAFGPSYVAYHLNW